MDNMDLVAAHSHCTANFNELMLSDNCGCFYCLEIYRPQEITSWVTERTGEQTATCPRCIIDSVIGDASGLPITAGFLRAMHEQWFGHLE